MTAHTCHALGCKTHCAPKMLMCRPCWSLVPGDIQREVYRTVKLRGPCVDKTWANWWRAAHMAIAHVALVQGKLSGDKVRTYIDKETAFADTLEARN